MAVRAAECAGLATHDSQMGTTAVLLHLTWTPSPCSRVLIGTNHTATLNTVTRAIVSFQLLTSQPVMDVHS